MRYAFVLLVGLGFSAGAPQPPDLRTRAEASDYVETSSYDDVMRLTKGVVASSPLAHYENFGTTEEKREMPLLVLSDPAVSTPEAARKLGRPIVFIQANIHAGEVEGKEAAVILARRLTSGDLKPMLRDVVVLMAPIYNADGNEKVNVQNRTAQNGPVAGVGTRENSKGLDLNRDYMKLDSAEARALVGLMNRWDPHVAIDLHTTNGSYHGYHLTYSPTLNPNADPRLLELAREQILPNVQQAVAKKHNFRTYYYGNFASESGGARETSRVDPASPGDTVWRTFDHRPRFGNNYVGLRNRLAILSEAYSYLDFRGRVRVTEVFVEECLRAIAATGRKLTALTAQLDADTKTYDGSTTSARRGAATPPSLGVEFQIAALSSPVDILVGDVTKQLNERSGREMLVMSDTVTPVRMKDYGIFQPTRMVAMPAGWMIPKPHVDSGRYAAAIDRLRWHGLRVQTISDSVQLDVQRFVVQSMTKSERLFQGHQEARLAGRHENAKLSIQAGALFVPANQPLARLAFYLLEAESDDGLVTWNFLGDGLTAGATFPVYRVMSTRGVRVE
jgi:hypothetical protein